MQITMLKSKIHRATVTDANLDYVGSITIDEKIMKKANIFENEKVQIVNINNGERFETYVIKGPFGKGDICLNGAAARLVQPKDKIIIMSYCIIDENEAENFSPTIVFVDEKNNIV
ncbi:MAG: Aspartate 1-decarboxylase [Sporanaerobacter sp.]|jgi:aspartate 1-decarboxylase|uniref:aspartate 1-decarboxylase n=1 Tax=Sporanaerobacter sp. TaxID=2010183 RepID=UPI003A103231